MEGEAWECLRIKSWVVEEGTVYYLIESGQEVNDLSYAGEVVSLKPKKLFRMRYNEFCSLRDRMDKQLVVFPPKKCLGNLQENFIKGRKTALQVFLN
jgi:hypothetical protein